MPKRRIVILTEGRSDPTAGKMVSGILRYRTDEVIALIASTQAGKTPPICSEWEATCPLWPL